MLYAALVAISLGLFASYASGPISKIAKKRFKKGRPIHTRWSRAPTKSEQNKARADRNRPGKSERKMLKGPGPGGPNAPDGGNPAPGPCPRCPELEAKIAKLEHEVEMLECQLSNAQRHIKEAVGKLEIRWPSCSMEHCVYYRTIIDSIKSKFG